MKKLLLFAITLFVAQANLKAQIGQPYAPVGAKWTYLDLNFINNPIPYREAESFQIEAVADTVIQNKLCSKLVFSGTSYQRTYYKFVETSPIMFYHTNNRQVFRYDAPLDSFCLLYDFNLSVGDTFKLQLSDNFFGGALRAYNAIITDTSQLAISGEILKGIKFNLLLDSGYQVLLGGAPSIEVFETLGALDGPAYTDNAVGMANNLACSLGPVTLRCYEDSTLGLYKSPGVVDCDTSFNTSVINNYFGKPMELYPNPAQNQVRINLGKEFTQEQSLILRDISGKLVKTFTIIEPNQTLDISGLAKGMYFVNIPGYRVEKLVIH